MKKLKTFPFDKARHLTRREQQQFKLAAEKKIGGKLPERGRPPKGLNKFIPIAIRLKPSTLSLLKKQAASMGIGYQTLINEILAKHVA